MTQLIPARNFTIVRQIGNHTDTATYYVRAVIRNAYTDVIIDTINLDNKGSQRFKKDWFVPSETSGLGGFISIVTSVYDDAGYIIKSVNYADEENTYLWATLAVSNNGGGFGEKFDYRRLREIVKEEIEKIPEQKEVIIPDFPKQKEYEMRWDDIIKEIEKVNIIVSKIPNKYVDTTKIFERFESVIQAIREKEITDISPILEMLREISKDDSSEKLIMDKIIEKFDGIVTFIDKIPTRTEQIFKENYRKQKEHELKNKEQEDVDVHKDDLLTKQLSI